MAFHGINTFTNGTTIWYIFWGCLTFACTIGIVVLLLLVGGSFQGIQEQSNKTNTVGE